LNSSHGLAEAIQRARRVYLIGNGGSYANAIHIQNDLIACGIMAHTLDPSTLTAIANDHGYEFIFSRWLMVVGQPGDLLVALSGSGKSPNILNAVKAAEVIGMVIWPIFGAARGENMQEAEEAQIRIGHEVRAILLDKRP
jgi:D-sedoheptulose 7-phosphate isomerase